MRRAQGRENSGALFSPRHAFLPYSGMARAPGRTQRATAGVGRGTFQRERRRARVRVRFPIMPTIADGLAPDGAVLVRGKCSVCSARFSRYLRERLREKSEVMREVSPARGYADLPDCGLGGARPGGGVSPTVCPTSPYTSAIGWKNSLK